MLLLIQLMHPFPSGFTKWMFCSIYIDAFKVCVILTFIFCFCLAVYNYFLANQYFESVEKFLIKETALPVVD